MSFDVVSMARRRVSPLTSAAFATVVGVAACGAAEGVTDLATLDRCIPDEGAESRWVPPKEGRYEARRWYGHGDEHWLADLRGAAWNDAGLWIYDGRLGTVVNLTEDLDVVRTIGGSGDGPGEIAVFRELTGWARGWITAHDSVVTVFDGRSFHTFGREGEFLGRRMVSQAAAQAFQTPRIEFRGGRLYLARDPPDTRSGTRSFEVGQVEGDALESILEVELPPLPRAERGFLSGGPVNQAQPSWAVSDRCLYMTDGGEWLVQLELETGALDSIRLPLWELPAENAEDEELRRQMLAMGRLRDAPDPTVLARWSQILVDPDGAVWLKQWRPHSQRYGPVHMLALTPAAARAVTLPGVPLAFGPPGTVFVSALDPETDVTLVGAAGVQ
jgi:hypothetical protein